MDRLRGQSQTRRQGSQAAQARFEAGGARRCAPRQAAGSDSLLSRRRTPHRMEIAKEFGYKVRAFHHALEAYKVADKLAATDVAIATFADWWGYKNEAWDAIPWNAVISMRKGVRVAIKSDSDDLARRLNQEAAKTMRYGGATEEEALRMITLNPAWIIGVENRVGSIEVGKEADLVIWDGYPLSSYGVPEKVLIDGDVYFDRSLPGFGMPHYKERE